MDKRKKGYRMKNNKVEIAGIVVDTKYTEKPYMLEVKLNVNRRDLGYVEHLKCFIADANLMKRNIKVGDYLYSNDAFLSSIKRLRDGRLECPRCHQSQDVKQGVIETCIILNDFIIKKGVVLEESIGINKVFLLGKIEDRIPYYADRLNLRFSMKCTEEQKNVLLTNHIKKQREINYEQMRIQCDLSIVEKVCQTVRMHRFVVIEGEVKQYIQSKRRPFRCDCLDALQDTEIKYIAHRIRAKDIRMVRITDDGYEDWYKKGAISSNLVSIF